MIALDFFSGSHGHFLEYLVNTYIFRGPKVNNSLTELGTSHNIRTDVEYMNFRLVEAGHYSEFNLITDVPSQPSQVIRISIDTEIEKICYQINVFFRAGDIPAENKLLQIPQHIRSQKNLLRNDLYSKLIDHGYPTPNEWQWNNVENFVFPMGAMYNINDLYQTLNRLSYFLGHSFNPDDSLCQLWQQFMEKNHGWIYWKKVNELLEKILSNTDFEFESDVWTQALINYLLTKIIGINNGPLHSNDDYPTNTSVIYQIIQQHIDDFDQKFKNQI